jgi:hypothetical protein
VVQVAAATSAFAEQERPQLSRNAGTGRHPKPRYPGKPSLKALALAAGPARAR